jgi:hypothetical protein
MRAGTFNINDYLNKLYEASDEKDEKEDDKKEEKAESKEKEKDEEHEAKESEEKEEKEEGEEKDDKKESSSKSSSPKPPATKGSSPSSPKGITNTDTVDQEGIILPEENKKFYSWLKGEFQKGKTEVKVEMKLGDSKFEPGYDMQAQPDTVNDFKPGMFGAAKTADNEGGAKTIGANQPNTNNQVTGLSKPAAPAGQGQELQKSKGMTVKSEPTKGAPGAEKPAEGGKTAPAAKPSSPDNAKQPPVPPTAAKPEEGEAEIEKIDIKTKKEKDAK